MSQMKESWMGYCDREAEVIHMHGRLWWHFEVKKYIRVVDQELYLHRITKHHSRRSADRDAKDWVEWLVL